MSEDDDVSHQPKNKTVVFTLEERKLLLKLVNMHFDVINNKKVDSVSTQLKNQAWEAIHKKYLENTGLVKLSRTPQQLKRCWENMKCKAKRGDPMSIKLLRWGEVQNKLSQSGAKNTKLQEKTNELNFTDLVDFELDENKDSCNYEPRAEETQNAVNNIIDQNFLNFKEAINNSDCNHCSCDKIERNAKLQLLSLQKQQYEELHQLKVQLTRERIKHEKELFKLNAHEMTLKVENERRRAEILERELNT